MAASNSAAKKQAKAINQSAQTAADAQTQSTQMQIDALNNAAAAGEAELRPIVQQGERPLYLHQAAYGLLPPDQQPAGRAAYTQAFEQSPYWQDALEATNRGVSALVSSNAAAGKGGAINSGKALRAASDIAQTYRGGATDKYISGLGGYIDRYDAAKSGIANLKIGAGTQVANAFGNQGNNLASIYANQGNALANIYGNQASNVAGFTGNVFSTLGNANWSVPNVFRNAPTKTGGGSWASNAGSWLGGKY